MTLSIGDVLALLGREIEQLGSAAAWAAQAHVTRAYVSDVVHKRREPGPKILCALGLEKLPRAPQRYRRNV